MTKKRFQKLLISISCPPKQAYVFKLPSDLVIAKNLFDWDLSSYQGCWNYLLHLIDVYYEDWYEVMGWNREMSPYKEIFHWDRERERKTSFTMNNTYVNEEVLKKYVYPQA